MGTMKIIGKAERKYTCDRMTISIHVIQLSATDTEESETVTVIWVLE